MFTVKRAIIMAAGFGSRLAPITLTTPKPLIKVNGVRMIDTIIEGLIHNEINEIYIVVGYLKEKFLKLPEEYKNRKTAKGRQIIIKIIDNPYYDKCNNISSLYVAKEHLFECVILDGDQVLVNPDILDTRVENSGYCSEWVKETDEWLQQLDEKGKVISCSRTGGKEGWELHGVSFWSEEDGKRLQTHLEKEFKENRNTDIYWDDIAMFCYPEEYDLGIRKINSGDVIEIDNLQELIREDSSYTLVLEEIKN